MIILDTNVISEIMRGPRADPAVRDWLRSLTTTPVTTVVNRAEILAGIALLPHGARTEQLREATRRAFGALGTCLPLTTECTDHYADIVAARRRAGLPIGGMDALIAAIARETAATIATRDVEGFSGLEVEVLDPWDGPR
jgi:toxin FitB